MIHEQVLLVDDEAKIVTSLSRELLEEDVCEVITAYSGQEALDILRNIPQLAAIVSDYYMPGMNGVELLSRIKKIQPDATRIMLTGAADLDMAIESVNSGNIFRFLLKPCPTDIFINTVKEAIKQYRLITGERELLGKTLNGSIKVMVDILAAMNPGVFAQSTRLRNMARALAEALHLEEQLWEVDLAALLSQIGAVTVPQEVLEKHQMGLALDEQESNLIESIPRNSRQLIMNIPRLENIAEAVTYQDCKFKTQIYSEDPFGEEIPIISRILKIVIDYDRFQNNQYSVLTSLQVLMQHEEEYDPELLKIFRTKVLRMSVTEAGVMAQSIKGEKMIDMEDLRTGMVLSRNIVDFNNRLVVAKGTYITDVLRLRLLNYFKTQAVIGAIYIESSAI